MSIFNNGVQISKNESTKSQLQQQSNYIFTVLRELHESGEPYEIIVDASKQKITLNTYDKSTLSTIISTQVIENNRFNYYLFVSSTTPIIDPTTTKNIEIEILITNAKNENEKYRSKTTISRL